TMVIEEVELPGGPFRLALVEVRFPEGTHETYQLLLAGDEPDGFSDSALARELVHLMRAGATLHGAEGTLEFRPAPGLAGLGRELQNARVVGGEQSNSSVVFDDELILKAFRRLEAGVNPELEM